ncbi:MAG: hypothetical protein NTV49_03920 [Kiritimatiellaeota bacterium]|nr:hypothetical protein [Kiritimatiellota bacterium]
MKILSTLSIEDLLAEVKRRQKILPKLLRRQAQLRKQLTAIEEQIQSLDSDAVQSGAARNVRRMKKGKVRNIAKAGKASPGPRPRNTISLMDALLKVLQVEQAMSIPEIIAAVARIGYQSKSKNFGVIVGQTLRTAKEKVVRVRRGAYALAG